MLWLVVLPLVSAATVVWWLEGQQAEPLGSDKNFTFPLAENNATTIGLIGVLLGCVTVAQLVRARVTIRDLRYVVASLIIGVAFGVGGRAATMTSHGANIGGGMFVLLGIPLLLVVTAMVTVRVAHPKPTTGQQPLT